MRNPQLILFAPIRNVHKQQIAKGYTKSIFIRILPPVMPQHKIIYVTQMAIKIHLYRKNI